MKRFGKIITKLLKQERGKSGFIFLSAYYPLEDKNKKQAKQRFKSLILNHFNQDKRLKHLRHLKIDLKKIVDNKLNQIPLLENGLGLFAKLPLKKNGTIPEEHITLTSLPHVFKKESFIDKTYDLDQLAFINSQGFTALIINLGHKDADFYLLNKDKWKKLTNLENDFFKVEEDEYLEKHAPLQGKSAIYGTGEANIARKKEAADQLFLNQVETHINTNKNFKLKTDYVLVFYSQSFAPFINQWQKKLAALLINSQVVLLPKNIQKEAEVKKQAKEEINKLQQEAKKDLFAKAQESYDNFVTNPAQIVEATREKRVSILFVEPDLKIKGWLINGSFVFLTKQKGAKRVRNIVPWLVKSIIESSGKIILINREDKLTKHKIAALLRF